MSHVACALPQAQLDSHTSQPTSVCTRAPHMHQQLLICLGLLHAPAGLGLGSPSATVLPLLHSSQVRARALADADAHLVPPAAEAEGRLRLPGVTCVLPLNSGLLFTGSTDR